MNWTLLMRLEGPMQSWGIQSRFEVRDTATEPSKSGVIGLVGAALGRDRAEAIDDLAALRMGVRVDREGTMRRDYQTAVRWKKDRRGGFVEGGTTLSERYYLANASFLVGLESPDRALLSSIDEALDTPHWPLSLGRKAFPPSAPVRTLDGLVALSLEEALRQAPVPALGVRTRRSEALRLVVERRSTSDEGLVVRRVPDQPVSFDPRSFAGREVTVSFMTPDPIGKEASDVPL